MASSTIAIIILLCVLTSFALNKISLGLTAMLGSLAMAVFGVMGFEDVFAGFGDNAVVMAFGVIVVGNSLFETGCAGLVGRKIAGCKRIGTNERVFLITILIITAAISAFVSNTATVAMMMPLIATVSAESNGRISKKNSYMAVGIASVLGGNATLAGSTPQIVAQGILQKTDGVRELTFFELTRSALPTLIVFFIYFATIGYKLQKKAFDFPEITDSATANRESDEIDIKKVWISAGIFLLCIFGFVSGYATFGAIAASCACLCVLTGCITPKRLWATMDWSTIAVLGGALGFAGGMSKSGAVELIAGRILVLLGGGSMFVIGAIIIVICALMSNLMSNTAVTAIMTPFAIALAQKMGGDAIPLVIMTIIGSNLAFATPVSTPPMTLTLSAGYRFTDFVKVGGLFNLIVVITAIVFIPIIYGIV